ncbi:hypothetical protein A7U60_g2391 [Sanghuangporus baumii]|uniref:Uncharacterized protein n=1 Tax=Sanghuangporus baumii TaxID=108892 RepID=A0A9Q5I2J9_SANBA|nr:hypothetical protein A7U60_g2391 [Sanghuangporus baumii]
MVLLTVYNTMSTIHAHTVNLFTAAAAHEATKKKLNLMDYKEVSSVVSEADKMAKGLDADESTGGDVSLYPAFAKEAAEYLVNAAGRTVFGLSWEPIKEDRYLTEFEIPDKRSTIMVPSELFPADSTDVVIQTNWFAPIYNCALNCKETRSGLHYGCKKTRSDHHYGPRRIMDKAKDARSDGSFEELSDDDAPFWKALQDPSSQFFKIVDYVTSVM